MPISHLSAEQWMTSLRDPSNWFVTINWRQMFACRSKHIHRQHTQWIEHGDLRTILFEASFDVKELFVVVVAIDTMWSLLTCPWRARDVSFYTFLVHMASDLQYYRHSRLCVWRVRLAQQFRSNRIKLSIGQPIQHPKLNLDISASGLSERVLVFFNVIGSTVGHYRCCCLLPFSASPIELPFFLPRRRSRCPS